MKRKSYAGRSRRPRRYAKRRRAYRGRRKSAYVKRSGVSVVKLKRTAYDGAWTFTTTGTNGFWRYRTYTMAQFNNFSELAAVFDEYRVCAIKETWRPRYDSVNTPSAAGQITQPQAYAHVIFDQNSQIVPSGTYTQANLNLFLENGSVRSKTLNRPFSMYFKPYVATPSATGTNRRIRMPWTPTSNTTTVMNGYHMYIQQNNMALLPTNENIELDAYITMYVMFRGQK